MGCPAVLPRKTPRWWSRVSPDGWRVVAKGGVHSLEWWSGRAESVPCRPSTGHRLRPSWRRARTGDRWPPGATRDGHEWADETTIRARIAALPPHVARTRRVTLPQPTEPTGRRRETRSPRVPSTIIRARPGKASQGQPGERPHRRAPFRRLVGARVGASGGGGGGWEF